MHRPEFLTAAALAVAGLGLALWLAANRVPATPAPPGPPEVAAATLRLPNPEGRSLPEAPVFAALPDIDLGPNGLPCGPTIAVENGAPGFVRLAVDAPCRAGEIVTVVHGPLHFSDRLSPRGTFRVEFPVLDAEAGFQARVGDRELEAAAATPEPLPVAISGLSWTGPLDISLAAFEFGAAEDTEGHVTSLNPRGAGRIVRLGDPSIGRATELYLGPDAGGPGVVRLHAEVTRVPELCTDAQPLSAFRFGPGGLQTRDVRLTLAPCDGLPETVLLKNLLEDLKIAGR
ncbi:MAG: hypothetical protein QNJ13_17240 [Paracoccaceae bacterium]|nr:hypothetical protein [Paracoccaceae bacterium]